jgi:hypothetical protein
MEEASLPEERILTRTGIMKIVERKKKRQVVAEMAVRSSLGEPFL